MSASAISWDAMLNMRKVELELTTDADMHLFFEKGMRDGVSYISKRYSKVNSKYLKLHDSKQESKHMCLGANNLYDNAMSKFFPPNGFKWIDIWFK